MAKLVAKKSPNEQAQIEAAETALKMARQNAKSAKARVRGLKFELKAARKRFKGLRKDMRAAKQTLAQVHERAAILATKAATKKRPSAPKPSAKATAARRKPAAVREEATKTASAVQSVKSIRLVRHKNPRPVVRPLSVPRALPQLTTPPVEVPATETPGTNTTAI
ncbi:MAG TPA: hypothetical protein VF848_07370 [Steroidobacteraceae bacterium]